MLPPPPRYGLTGRPPRLYRGLSPPLIGEALPLRASKLLSQDGFCLSGALSSESAPQ